MGAVKKLRSIASELLKIETWPLHRIKPYERNARKIPKAAIEKVALSLREFGWQQPLVLEPDGTIIVGHVRRLGALLNGWTEAPVTIAHGLTDEQIKAYRLMDNRSHEEAGWDNKLLALDLSDLRGFDMSLTGFGDAELRRLLPSDQAEPEAQMDRAEELLGKWKVERGQIWEIGKHWLMCGDSTSSDVDWLMNGGRVSAVLTDPPYGTSQEGIPHDDPEELQAICKTSIARLPCDNAVVVAFQSPRTFPAWLDAARDCGLKFERMLWLSKEAQCANPWRGWIMKSEAILVATKGRGDWQDIHPYSHDCYSVPEVSGELTANLGWHGAVKPLKIVADLLSRICGPGKSVYDPFIGSGTTMVAAESLGCVCYGMEIDPKYCAVILERMSDMGLTPRLT